MLPIGSHLAPNVNNKSSDSNSMLLNSVSLIDKSQIMEVNVKNPVDAQSSNKKSPNKGSQGIVKHDLTHSMAFDGPSENLDCTNLNDLTLNNYP